MPDLADSASCVSRRCWPPGFDGVIAQQLGLQHIGWDSGAVVGQLVPEFDGHHGEFTVAVFLDFVQHAPVAHTQPVAAEALQLLDVVVDGERGSNRANICDRLLVAGFHCAWAHALEAS